MGTPTRLGAHFLWLNNQRFRLFGHEDQRDLVVIVRKNPIIFS